VSNLDLTWAVRGVDAILRLRQGIEEYTDDRNCIFRISMETAVGAAILSDGAAIRPGDPLVQIHYWNEHMPVLPDNGGLTGWASLFRHRIAHSLTLLNAYLDTELRFRGVAGIHGLPTFPARPGPLALSRTCEHLGFDVMPLEDGAIHAWLDSLLISGLIWTFNPASLRNHGLTRGRIQIWMSRATLTKRYGGMAERH